MDFVGCCCLFRCSNTARVKDLCHQHDTTIWDPTRRDADILGPLWSPGRRPQVCDSDEFRGVSCRGSRGEAPCALQTVRGNQEVREKGVRSKEVAPSGHAGLRGGKVEPKSRQPGPLSAILILLSFRIFPENWVPLVVCHVASTISCHCVGCMRLLFVCGFLMVSVVILLCGDWHYDAERHMADFQ